ncbi:type II toxin-antitoxin system HicB family antitoxin [Bradyrhizobium sp. HKCCYLS2033]|uniref:type II toxin-antitoxin system HicB family antitoxin n=1 Tax=unclassified Bradyrhizobium TaxID=2631580 RepID=UPI003EBD9E0F
MNANRYPAQVFYSDEDEGFIAVAPDLPGCSAFGETQTEALTELQTAIEVWLDAAQKAGNPVPSPSKPVSEPLPSGKVLVRMPRTLHQQLLDRAVYEHTSLNQLVIMMLSAAIAVRTSETITTTVSGIGAWKVAGITGFAGGFGYSPHGTVYSSGITDRLRAIAGTTVNLPAGTGGSVTLSTASETTAEAIRIWTAGRERTVHG